MKENPRTVTITGTAKPARSSLAAAPNKPIEIAHRDSANLSPEKIQQKLSSSSKVLIRILERDETIHYTRHWGINE